MTPTPAATSLRNVPKPRPIRARAAPCLWFTRLPLQELVELLRARHFPRLQPAHEALLVQFAVQERLVELAPGDPITLSFHEVLNQAATPVEVFGALAKWALARIDRPDATRAPFAALCPEESFSEAWLDHFLGACLRRSTKPADEAPEVLKSWRDLWLRPRPLPPPLRLERSQVEAALLRFANG